MSFAGAGQNINLTLTAEDQMSDVLRGASDAIGVFTGNAERMVSSLARMGAAAAPILAIGAAFLYAGQQASSVQQNVANLNAVLHATGEQLAEIRAQGLALSQATQFTDAQILSAQRQLAKGGGGVGDVLQETPSALNLAAATGASDPTAAATSLITAQKAFDVSGSDAAKTATTLAQAVDSSVGSLANQASALKQVGATAHAAGIGLRDTVTAIADLQNSGLQGDSGTALKTFLARVESPTAAAKKEIDALGLSFYDLQGNLKPIPELFDEIRQKTLGLDSETSNAALFKIFGQRGVRVADIAAEQGSSGFVETAQSMAEKGDAAEIAARKLDTFQGSVHKAASSLNVLAVQGGTVFLPAMRDVADVIEHTANALSTLNNHQAVLPQLLVGAAAVGGLGLADRALGKRADSREADAAAEAEKANRARVEAAAGYSNQVAQAEFTADSKIVAAHQEMVAKLRTLDQSQYESYLAMEAKTVSALQEAEEKKFAVLQATTEKTLLAIAEIDRAQEAAAKAQTERAVLAADKQRALLVSSQQAQVESLAVQSRGAGGFFTKEQTLGQQQGVDTAALERRIAIEQEFAAKEANITAEGYQLRREAEVRGGEQLVMERERQAEASLRSITAKGAAEQEAILAAGTKNAEAIALAYEAERVAAEKGRLGAVGSVVPLGGGATETVEGSIAAGLKGSGVAATVPVAAKLTMKELIAEEGFFGAVSTGATNLFKGAAGKIGQLFLPAIVALSLEELVVQPLFDAINKKWAERTIGKPINLSLFSTDPSQESASFEKSSDDLTKYIADQKQKVADAQKEIDGLKSGGFWERGINNFLAGPGGESTGEDRKIIEEGDKNVAAAEEQKRKIEQLNQVAPAAALSKTADEQATLIGLYRTGIITLDQAQARYRSFNASVDEATNALRDNDAAMRARGVSEEKIAQSDQQWAQGLAAATKALEDQRQQAEADYQANLQAAMRSNALGAPTDVSSVAAFGKHADGGEATKAEVAKAKQAIADLEAAWKGAQQTVNSIDISKGFDAFAKGADAIRLANQELARVGQGNAALQNLGQIATEFAKVTEVEGQATRALDGYAFTLQKTQGYATELGKVQKEFETALEFAEQRQNAGRASQADLDLIANKGNIRGNLSNQQETLSEHMVLDVLGTVKNLPDFAALDDYVRDVIAKAGGGIEVVATIKASTADAKREIEDILKPREMSVVMVIDFSKFDPALEIARSKMKGIMTDGMSPYDERPPAAPPAGGAAPPAAWDGSDTRARIGQAGDASQSPLGFRPLDPNAYTAIVRNGSAGQTSPFEDPAIYAAVMKAAQDAGVDPRALLAFTKHENNNAVNISSANLAANNFGGIKYSPNDPTETRGPRSPEGDNYAAFADPAEFFRHLAANLTTGDYANDFAKGDLGAIRTRYVAGNAKPTLDQSINIAGTVADYNDYRNRFPSGDAGAGAGGYNPAQVAASEHLTTQQNIEQQSDVAQGAGQNTGSTSTILAAAKRDIGQQKDRFNRDVYGWCLEIVQDIMQEAGFDERGKHPEFSNTADERIKAAEHGMPGAGRVIDRADARPGDIVGWEGSNPQAGDSRGHIGIYSGGDKYIGTTANGVQERTLMAGAIFIRPDGVVAGGPEPGTVVYQQPHGAGYAQSEHGQTVAGSSGGRTLDATGKPIQEPLTDNPYPTAALPAMQQYARNMQADPDAFGKADAITKRFAPLQTDIERNALFPGQEALNKTEKANVDNAALKDNLELTNAVGDAMRTVNANGAITEEQWKRITAAAGPMAPLVREQVQITADLAAHTTRLNDLKEASNKLDRDHQVATEGFTRQGDTLDVAHRDFGVKHENETVDIEAGRRAQTRKEEDQQTQTAADRLRQTRREEDTERQTAADRLKQTRAEADQQETMAAERLAQTRKEQDEQIATSAVRLAQTRKEQDEQVAVAAERLAQTRAEQDAAIQTANNRRVVQEAEQDYDRLEQHKRDMFQRTIDDQRLAQSRLWEDQAYATQQQIDAINKAAQAQDMADRDRKQAEDDRYTTLTRQEEDTRRVEEFNGGQRMVQLKDELKLLEDQHRLTVEGMEQNQRLQVDLGKGSGTEAEALAHASQAAAINDARKQADDLYKKQQDANVREQDAEAKLHAQVMFDLETQSIAQQRLHEDTLKAIDREEQARHDQTQRQLDLINEEEKAIARSHTLILRQQQDEDTARQRATEDDLFAIQTVRIAEQRRWAEEDRNVAAAILAEQRRWQDDDLARQADILAEQRRWQDDDVQRSNDILAEQRRWQDIDIARQHDILLEQRRWQDVDIARANDKIFEQRRWQDVDIARQEDKRREARRWQDEDLGRQEAVRKENEKYNNEKEKIRLATIDENEKYKNAHNLNATQQQEEEAAIKKLTTQQTNLDIVIGKWDTLLTKFGKAADAALGNSGSAPPPSSGPAPVRKLGEAGGGTTFPGMTEINEQGGEFIVSRGGDTVIPADQSKRLVDMLLGRQGAGAGGGGATSVAENITVNLNDSDAGLSPEAKARIRAVIRQELEAAAPVSQRSFNASRGLRR